MSAAVSDAIDLSQAKRAVITIAGAQAIIGSAAPIAISLGGITGHYLLGPDKTLATSPVTGFTLGIALGAIPAAMLMKAFGRRNGFVAGAIVTAIGGGIACLSVLQGSFALFVAALALIGIGGGFVQQYRFAAADVSPVEFKPKAISWVLGGGVFAAILGPQTVIWTKDLFLPVQFAGAFAALIVLGIIGAGVLSFLRIPEDTPENDASDRAPQRPLLQIITTPRFLVAFMCAVTAYGLMTFVMTGAPLAMVLCGFSTDQSTLGISLHVMAMFGPSFVTGHLIKRFGVENIVGAGLLILITCTLVAMSGVELWQFWLALILLGVGWNFGFIGATAMIATTYNSSEKNKVQGAHDFVLFSIVAVASLLSGGALNAFGPSAETGWFWLNLISLPIAIVTLGALVFFTLRTKRTGVAAQVS
ncbi:MAG: MFS transporter [Pseudomonadota bacterium]